MEGTVLLEPHKAPNCMTWLKLPRHPSLVASVTSPSHAPSRNNHFHAVGTAVVFPTIQRNSSARSAFKMPDFKLSAQLKGHDSDVSMPVPSEA